jgi:hypothetical protein
MKQNVLHFKIILINSYSCDRILVGRPEGRRPLEDRGIDGRILKWIFKKWNGGGVDRIAVSQDRDKAVGT